MTNRHAYFLVFFCWLFINFPVFSQKCSQADKWIKVSANYVEMDSCKQIKNHLESILEDCLTEKDTLDSTLGDLYHELGRIYLDCGFERSKTLLFFQKAIAAKKRAKTINHESLAKSFHNKNTIYYYEDDYPMVKQNMKQAIFHLKKVNSLSSQGLLASSYNTLAYAYKEEGDYHQALLFVRIAAKNIDKRNIEEHCRLLINHAQIYDKLGQYQKALAKYKEVITIIKNNGINSYINSYAYTLSDMGSLQLNLNNYKESIELFNQALPIFLHEEPVDTYNIINLYTNLILSSTKLNQYDKANTYFEQGLAIALAHYKSSNQPIIAELYSHKATTDKAQKDYPTAEKNFQNALKSLIPSFQPKTLAENPILSHQPTGDKIRLRTALYLKAQTYQQKYDEEKKQTDLATIFDTYLTLDTLITQTRQSFKAVESKYFLQATIVPIYEQAIKTALALYELTNKPSYKEAAHAFLARNKAIILIEDLEDEKIKFTNIPDSLQAKEAQLKKTSYELETTIYELGQEAEAGVEAKIKHLQDSLFITKNAHVQLIADFEKDYPLYYQSKHNYFPSLSIANIQKELESNQAVIEFFIGEKILFVSAISKNDFQIYPTTLPKNFETLTSDFIRMTRGDSLEEKRFATTAFQLYQDLLQKPLEALDAKINRLTIIPDDLLLLLPFDVLLTQPHVITPDTWHEEDIPFLLQKYALSQVYASSLLFNKQDQQRLKQAKKPFLGFGLESYDYTKTKDTINSALDSIFQRNINNKLPFSGDEVRNIQGIIGGDTLINEAATKQFLRDYGHEYRILHFATHGFAAEDSPNNSALVFAKLPNQSDYLLRASELYAMKFNAELVVLSACQTNYGTLQKGEGMRTLSRAFAYAGSPNLVASLSNIIDRSSKDIFTNFYRNLKQGQTRDVALQQAKLAYLKNTDDPNKAHPHYWAQTILIGESQVLDVGNAIPKIWYLVGGMMLLLFLLWRGLKSREHGT